MNYFISSSDRKLRAEKIASFLICFKHKLDNPNFRTNHNLNKWKFYKNKCNKQLSSLGYKLNLEMEVLRELIPMKSKNPDSPKAIITRARENLEMTRRKYINAKDEMLKAKQEYISLLEKHTNKDNS